MATEEKGRIPERDQQKTIWRYAGKVTLWLALILFGLALERLGLTSDILSETLPGEVQKLRVDLAETQEKSSMIKLEKKQLEVTIGGIVDTGVLDDLKQCLDEIKKIEASLQGIPAAEAPPSQ